MMSPTEELTFYKSSYSGSDGNCVEVARFRKSSYSQSEAACVEIADLPTGAAVRDTQNRQAGHLSFAGAEWTAALRALRTGQD